jgi:hypothetical protein
MSFLEMPLPVAPIVDLWYCKQLTEATGKNPATFHRFARDSEAEHRRIKAQGDFARGISDEIWLCPDSATPHATVFSLCLYQLSPCTDGCSRNVVGSVVQTLSQIFNMHV